MRIGVPREDGRRERRVAITPDGVAKLVAGGHEVTVEVGAGLRAGFADADYRQAGAKLDQRPAVIGNSGVVTQVNGPTATELVSPEWGAIGPDHVLIGLHDPLWQTDRAQALSDSGATIVSLELIPRTTKAQSMDVLSSTATVVGYQAALLAASRLPRILPMMMTAAGTVTPARFVVLGAGVAGLQAIATARRLGAVVEGYDIRPAATEQIRSLGAKAIELDLGLGQSGEGEGGYAAEQTDDLNRRQNELLTPFIADADAVITTAAIPGAASPELVTTDMVDAMSAGSVIIDLAAERGGNCRLTQADDEVNHDGVAILGPTDLASRAAATTSQMFSNNVLSLLAHLAPGDDGGAEPDFDVDDEIVQGVIVARRGEVRHPRVRQALGLEPLAADSQQAPESEDEPETIQQDAEEAE